ncbi:hypothetical protein Gogos_001665 [Gossypium gossypioides]|uniref:Uncharacterized protein n=1 Tax=Gossypium gossypioides TaxID=34282 RepID=A0A7J9CP33_GOSGO|nr:hypothetical protein [Gossypium gossypioides]
MEEEFASVPLDDIEEEAW